MKKTILLLIGLSMAFFLKAQTATPPSTGNGTTENPYEIATLNNLYWLTQNSAEWDKYYIQTANIDASSTNTWDVGNHDNDDGTTPDEPMGFSPIGNSSVEFTGSYNGKGYTISKVFINRPTINNVGLFGKNYGALDSIGLININYTFRTGGGLAGINKDSINSCYTTGNITGSTSYMAVSAGFVGDNGTSALISNSHSSCNVTGSTSYSSGFVGYNQASINNSFCTGSINSQGLVGYYNDHASPVVENSFWDTEISGTTTSAGGTGKTTTEMKDIANFTDITTVGLDAAWDFVGTLNDDSGTDDIWAIAYNGYPALSWQDSLLALVSTDSISDITVSTVNINGNMVFLGSSNPTAYGFCWNTTGDPTTADSKDDKGTTSATGAFVSNVTGLTDGQTYYIRAFAANEFGTFYGNELEFSIDKAIVVTDSISNITDNSAIGYANITALGSSAITNHGFCWNTTGDPTITDNKSDEGATSSTGVFATNITGLISGSKYFTKAYVTNSEGTTSYGDEISFTIIIKPTGLGTEETPYQIATLSNLRWLSENSAGWDKYYIQTADIDASSTSTWNIGNHDNDGLTPEEAMGLSPIGNSETNFTGSYNGQEHIIDSLYINRPTVTYAGVFGRIKDAPISDIEIINVNINAYSSIGALVGNCENSNVDNCYSSGNIEGSSAGGLIGVAHSSSTIQNCYSIANVNGSSTIGGFIGSADGASISNCYSTGIVTGNNNVGGFGGSINNTLAENLFWDTETSSTTTSASATGKTTAQMQDISTFTDIATDGLDAAWDFVGTLNDDNGTDDIWAIKYNGYPALSWQDSLLALVTSDSISDIAETVNLNGNMIFLGATNPTAYGFCWNTTGDPTTTDSKDDKGIASATGTFVSNVAGLNDGQTYYIRAFTTNEFGTFYGTELEFSVDMAIVVTDSVSEINENSAIGHGNITTMGLSDLTAHGFCWNITGNPSLIDSKSNEGATSSTGVFTTDITGLESGSKYFVKAYATNSEGETSYGDEINFTTIIVKPVGLGTEETPYQIATLSDLRWLSQNSAEWDKYYIQTADIDASTTSSWNIGNHDNDAGTPNEAMGFSPIGNINEFTGSYNGKGHVINSLFINRPIDDFIGLFGKMNLASIDSLGLSDINITGNENVGGLIGLVSNTPVNNCYSTGSVNAYSKVGGLVGEIAHNAVRNCYSMTNVNSDSYYAGGLVGYNSATLSNCYSTGSVSGNNYVGGLVGENASVVENSFWDTETSGTTISAGGTGKTSAEMKTLCIYISANWNIPEIWVMNSSENSAYPALAWQDIEHTEKCQISIDGSFTANSKIYNGTNSAILNENLLSLTGQYSSDDVSLTNIIVEFTDKTVDSGKTVNITEAELIGNDAGNYALYFTGTPTAIADITSKDLTILGVTIDNKVYDALNSANISGTASIDGIVSGDNIILDETSVNAVFDNKNVASDKTVTVTGYDISGTDISNYTLFQPTGFTADITKALLSATAEDKSKTYGGENPALTITYSGFINSESESVLTTAPTASTTVDATSNAGTYNITVSGGEADNYGFAYVSGILTVDQSAITATARDTSRYVGEANPEFVIDYAGFVNEDNESTFTTLPTATTTADETSQVGTYDIIVSGGEAMNYIFNYAIGILTVNEEETTDIEDIVSNHISIYPNPVSDILNINNIKTKNAEIRIYNIQTS